MASTNNKQKKVNNSKVTKKVEDKNIPLKKATSTKPIAKKASPKTKPIAKKAVDKKPETKSMISNSIENTGPILTGGGFISDKILFSGEVENIPTQSEEEEEKRSKWNTNTLEREEAVLCFEEAEKRMKALLSEHWDKKSKTIIKKISPKIKREIEEIQIKFGIDNILTESISLKEVPKTKKELQASPNALKVDEEFEKTRMTVKSFDQISEDLKPGNKLSEDIEITPFSNFIERKDVDNTVSKELFKKINAFSDSEIKILGNQINDYLQKDEVEKKGSNHNESKIYEKMESLEKKSKENGLATIEEMSNEQVGGIGKPKGKINTSYNFKPNKQFKYLKKQETEMSLEDRTSVFKIKNQKKNNASPTFSNEFQNKKPEIKSSKELKKEMRKSHFQNPVSKKTKGSSPSAIEQIRKEKGTPGGWRNPNNINDDGLSNVDSRNKHEDSLGKQPSYTMSKKTSYASSTDIKKQIKKHKPKHHKQHKAIMVGQYDIKDVEKNISEQMTRLDKFHFEGLSDRKDFGGLYQTSLGKDASDMIKFRNNNLQNVNKQQPNKKFKRRK